MRVIIPNVPGKDNFAENVAVTLTDMGHDVIVPDRRIVASPTTPVGVVVRDLLNRAFPSRWSAQDKWLVQAARTHRPDVVLCLTHAPNDEALAAVRTAGVRHIAAWWGDAPANMRRMGLLSDQWDAIWIKDADAVRKFQTVGLPAALLHEAMNPKWHRPSFSTIGPDLAIAGNYYAFRQILVDRLAARGIPLSLYGSPPPRWSLPAVRERYTGKYIVREEKSRVFGSALACLNSQSLSEGNSLNCRAFEIAGAGGLQLIEDKPVIAECFAPGEEILTYASVDDIVAYADRATHEPRWALNIKHAAHRRANAEHTYAHRLQRIFDHADR